MTARELAATLVAIFAMGALFGWGVWGTPKIMAKVISSTTLAAWAQAVGVIAALVLTYWIASRESRERRGAAQAAARAAALRLLLPMRDLSQKADWTLGQLDAGMHPARIGQQERGRFGVEWLTSDLKKVADLVTDAAALMEYSETVQKAMIAALRLRNEIYEYYDEHAYPGDEWAFGVEEFAPTHETIRKFSEDMCAAVAAIESLLDQSKS